MRIGGIRGKVGMEGGLSIARGEGNTLLRMDLGYGMGKLAMMGAWDGAIMTYDFLYMVISEDLHVFVQATQFFPYRGIFTRYTNCKTSNKHL